MTWGYFYCPYCRTSRKSNSDLWSYDGDTITECCNKSECLEENTKKLKREQKIADIEAELARSKAEAERLREQLAENERKTQTNQRTESNSNPSNNNKHPDNCGVCEKNITVGETYHHWSGPPAIDICGPCKPRFLLQTAAQEAILKGENINVRVLDLPTEDKICLEAFQKIVKREPINIDNLTIDNKDKENLKQLQQQFPANQSPSNNSSQNSLLNTNNIPKPLGIYKYASNCRSCQKQWEFIQIPPHCPSCQSRQIDVYDANGFAQILPPDDQKNNNPVNRENNNIFESPVFWIGILIVLVLISIPLFIWRSKKIKEYKQIGKKVPWWF